MHRLQQMPERLRVARRELVREPQHRERVALVALLAGQLPQALEPERGARAAGGDGAVLQLLAPRDQRFAVGGGGEEPSVLRVGEARDQLVRERARLLEPALLAARFEQREQGLEQERVVLEVGADARLAVVVGAQQAPVAVAHARQHELRAGRRRVEVAGLRERRARVCQRRDHERVPARHALVVEARAHALDARRAKRPADPLALLRGRARTAAGEYVEARLRMVRVREVALLGDAEPRDRGVRVGAQQRAQLLGAPHVEGVPPRRPSPRRAPSRSRPRARASRAAPTRARPRTPRAAAPRPTPRTRAGTRARAARCRRASSRSAAQSSSRRRCSARSRRRAGRGCRPRPSRAAS